MMILITVSMMIYFVKSPSLSNSWSLGNAHSPSVTISDDQVEIQNYRDIDWVKFYKTPADSIQARKLIEQQGYRTLNFPLSDIQTLKVAVSHFSAVSEIAHLFILFELKDKQVIGLSVEARKEQGEDYSLIGGLTAKFEVIYLLGSHNDLVGLRQKRYEDVYIYPIKAKPAEVQALFKVAAARTNQLDKNPELYHLFFKNCTTEIVSLVNQLTDQKYPWFVQHLAPGDAGKALYELDMIDVKADSFEELQKLTLYKP
ncbi:DUF4105 domain-containing protein [uncultured Cocleimonas sp.]|uniref:lipoprotein N-acyltransferase Lnb domain-containing protein n=1 Tax=uncultured Cocleimonas sp. TaxID=1051587 RepID=UPI002630CB01|nr:DUF4105 domain-containing protein [uncultured Cocleimonas sp.]